MKRKKEITALSIGLLMILAMTSTAQAQSYTIVVVWEEWTGIHTVEDNYGSGWGAYTGGGVYVEVTYEYKWHTHANKIDQDSVWSQEWNNITVANFTLFVGYVTHPHPAHGEEFIVQVKDYYDAWITVYDTGQTFGAADVNPAIFWTFYTTGIPIDGTKPFTIRLLLYDWAYWTGAHIVRGGVADGPNLIDVDVVTGVGFEAFDPYLVIGIEDTLLGYRTQVLIEEEEPEKDDSPVDKALDSFFEQVSKFVEEYWIQIAGIAGGAATTAVIGTIRYNEAKRQKQELAKKGKSIFKR
jgi:hypothetical protein